jgi:hypothetical protein
MKKALFLLASTFALNVEAQQIKERVAIFFVEDTKEITTSEERSVLTDALAKAALTAVGAEYKVLSRELVAGLASAQNLQNFIEKNYIEIGNMLQSQYIIGSNINKLGEEYVMTIEVYNIKEVTFIGSEQYHAKSLNDLYVILKTNFVSVLRSTFNVPKVVKVEAEPTIVLTSKKKKESDVPDGFFKSGDVFWEIEGYETRNWHTAYNYCAGRGLRLPEFHEAQNFAKTLSKNGVNYASGYIWTNDFGYYQKSQEKYFTATGLHWREGSTSEFNFINGDVEKDKYFGKNKNFVVYARCVKGKIGPPPHIKIGNVSWMQIVPRENHVTYNSAEEFCKTFNWRIPNIQEVREYSLATKNSQTVGKEQFESPYDTIFWVNDMNKNKHRYMFAEYSTLKEYDKMMNSGELKKERFVEITTSDKNYDRNYFTCVKSQ